MTSFRSVRTAFDAVFVDGKAVDPRAVVLEVQQEYIPLESMSNWVADPEWTLVDRAGHFHAFDKAGKTPTLVGETEIYFCVDCNDDHERDTMHCRLCGVVVEPRLINKGPTQTSIRGPRLTELKVPVEVAGDVSVRLVSKGGELFGTMTVTLVESEEADGHIDARTTLHGELHPRLAHA